MASSGASSRRPRWTGSSRKRAPRSAPPAREALYRRFEQLLVDDAVLIPLFHEVDYRIAGPGVKGVKLSSSPPFVSYAEIAKTAVTEETPREWAGGILHVPIAGIVQSIDPAFAATMEQGEVVPIVFETLNRDIGGARVVPWLASEVRPENGLTQFRFRLRPGVRFHDGRTLTARDVRFSFERLLQNPEGYGRSLLSAIRGAKRFIERRGRRARGLSHRLAHRAHHRPGETGLLLPGPRVVPRHSRGARGNQHAW